MSHHTYTATQPTYWLACDGTNVEKGNYGYLFTGFQLETEQEQLETFATEAELAARIDAIKGIPGWYYLPENKIPE